MPHDRSAEQRLRELEDRRAAASFLEELTQFDGVSIEPGVELELRLGGIAIEDLHFAAHEEGEAACAEVVHLGNFGRNVIRDDEIVVARLNGRVLR